MASLGLTLAREATIPIDLAEEVRSLLDKNPREWAPSLLYETATGEKIKDTERRVSEFRAITDDSELSSRRRASLMRSSGRSRPNASNCRSSRRPSARISATSPCTAT